MAAVALPASFANFKLSPVISTVVLLILVIEPVTCRFPATIALPLAPSAPGSIVNVP